jgi:hypothetical protein
MEENMIIAFSFCFESFVAAATNGSRKDNPKWAQENLSVPLSSSQITRGHAAGGAVG